jgi:hypothetical protein
MSGELKLGEMVEAKYVRMVMRVLQTEDRLRISVYDSGSPRPDEAVWQGESAVLEDAKRIGRAAAVGYCTGHGMHLIKKGDKVTARAAASGRTFFNLQPVLIWQNVSSTNI